MEGTMTERKDDRDDSNEDERTIFVTNLPTDIKTIKKENSCKSKVATTLGDYKFYALTEKSRKYSCQCVHPIHRCIKRRQYDKKRAVFLGNLAFDIGEEEIYTHFTDCGEIDRIRVVRDPHNYIGKGFGFESYSVGLALKLNDSLLKNRKIRVTRVGKKSDEHKMKAKVLQRRISSMNKVQQKKGTATFKKRKPAEVKQFSRKLKKQVSKKPARSFMK
ncbi:RNA-binding protein 34 [Trichinella spiralis]|uniref:RNA-binding protein 34 n=1 Tax=Trichinella spiralis TaxID=6334 RepID=UPI0001EFC322|nr:RNA-binding protein 34 [Trichinella spiralis]